MQAFFRRPKPLLPFFPPISRPRTEFENQERYCDTLLPTKIPIQEECGAKKNIHIHKARSGWWWRSKTAKRRAFGKEKYLIVCGGKRKEGREGNIMASCSVIECLSRRMRERW